MSVARVNWRPLPGCGQHCSPPRYHDAAAHEAYGFRLGVLAATAPPPRVVRSGVLTVDLEYQTALIGTTPVPLTQREWQTLAYLAERPGRKVTATELAARAYEHEYSEHAARVYLSRVRSQLGPAREIIESTGWGYGVRFRVDPPRGDPPTRPYTYGERARWQTPPRWSRHHATCTCCGRTDRPYYGGGRCSRCYCRSTDSTLHYGPCRAPGGAP